MKTILLIEDDLALAATIKNFFKLKGFEVLHADNGAEGIQMAFSFSPDAIVCDIDIPVADGYQVHKILNETPSTYLMPFIFLTAKTSIKDIRAGMQLGADDYITKPFDFNDLLNAVTTRISKREKFFKTNEDKFQRLLDNSPHGVFVCQEKSFIEVNRKMAEYFKISQMEMLELCFTDIADNSDKKKVELALHECIALRKKEFSLEFTGRDKNQNTIPLKLMAGYSYYKGKDCIVGNLINLNSSEYSLKDIELNSSDLKELGNAIELFSSDYNLISKSLVDKLSGIFTLETENNDINKVELSTRETEVLNEICLGKSTSEIAETLFISERTVEKHRAAIVQKTGAKHMREAVIFAIKNNLVRL
jgi:PAS domain S-box-containing protein